MFRSLVGSLLFTGSILWLGFPLLLEGGVQMPASFMVFRRRGSQMV
jgi:hypothetical protein